ncbi:MAG: hypothetical protein ACD_19C00191G0001 [uncultured bacterium]|nr:MAG: hypothetical protein ACD_19C00191G0001 [uncultured bacterium]
MYIAQPSPTPKTTPAGVYSPVPAPAPQQQWSNNAWNQVFNDYWNKGYNQNFGSNFSGSGLYGDAQTKGYLAGLSKAPTTQKVNTPTGLQNNSFQQQSSPVSNEPDINGMQNQMDSQIQSMYNENVGLFNAQEANLGSQKTLSEQGVQLQGTQAKSAYQLALDQAMQSSATQQNTLNQTKQSSDSESLRNFNALAQNAQSRYGNGSSTGGAVFEVISQEFLRNKNNLSVAFQNSLDKVFQYQAQSQQIHQSAVQKLEEDISMKVKEIDQAWKDGLLNIQLQRNANENAKSQARISLLQDTLANARNIQNYKIEAQVQLDTWLTQQKQTNSDALSYAKSLASQSEMNTLNSASDMQVQNNSSFLNYNDAKGTTAMVRPQAKKYPDDYEDFQNPWLA